MPAVTALPLNTPPPQMPRRPLETQQAQTFYTLWTPQDTLDYGAAGPAPSIVNAHPGLTSPVLKPTPKPTPAKSAQTAPNPDRQAYVDACVRLVFGPVRTRQADYAAQMDRTFLALNEDPKVIHDTLVRMTTLQAPSGAQLGDEDLRRRALTVVLEAHTATLIVPAAEQITRARAMPWTRLVGFVGSASLVGLKDVTFVGTFACATYLASQAAVGGAASFKGASLLGKAKGLTMAISGGVMVGMLGAATAVSAGYSFAEAYDCISAFRDVWDNGFGRDAYFLHQIVAHHALTETPHRTLQCYHAHDGVGDGGWTNPVVRTAAWRRGQGFSS